LIAQNAIVICTELIRKAVTPQISRSHTLQCITIIGYQQLLYYSSLCLILHNNQHEVWTKHDHKRPWRCKPFLSYSTELMRSQP